jgi:hypothetical protein
MPRANYCTAFLFWSFVWAVGAQNPVNDYYINRVVLRGESISFTGSLAGATIESNEIFSMNCLPSAPLTLPGSVWFEWTASRSTVAWFHVTGFSTNSYGQDNVMIYAATNLPADFPTWLAGESLPMAGCMDLDSALSFQGFGFAAESNVTYLVQLRGSRRGEVAMHVDGRGLPVILQQPNHITLISGAAALVKVTAAGDALTYQWRKDGTDLPGESGAMVMLTNVTAGDSGSYSVQIRNTNGVVVSDGADLVISQSGQRPSLVPTRVTSGVFEFRLTAEANKAYRVESTADFAMWNNEASFQMDWLRQTSIIVPPAPTTTWECPTQGSRKFLRVASYHPADEGCNGNLKQFRHAKDLWARENRRTRFDTPPVSAIRPYFKSEGFPPTCPAGGFYTLNQIDTLPRCTVSGHVLEEPQ